MQNISPLGFKPIVAGDPMASAHQSSDIRPNGCHIGSPVHVHRQKEVLSQLVIGMLDV